ncbi:MAG: ferritin-like domain-containing protein [Armatimonadetes bacterium]|nr:ferritin-like domain-containing protein [Anaerolineae bacterium]
MAQANLHDLLLDELKDIYDAETQLTQALPKMMEAATSDELKKAFKSHLAQTQGQLKRLEQAFEMMGKKADRKTCKAMKGLLAEGEDMIKEHEQSHVLDAGLIGSAQRVEHYEIAAYGTICAYADALGEDDLAGLLAETLAEEKQTDEALSVLGAKINEACAEAYHASMDDESDDSNGKQKSKGKGKKSKNPTA